MIKIHHNTQAKANNLGFTIRHNDTSFIVERTDTPDRYTWAVGDNPKDTLDQAILEYATYIETQTDNVVVMAEHYRDTYRATGDNCNDPIAQQMLGLDHEEVCNVAKLNGIDYNKYLHLNNGMFRMNVGNRLLRRGDNVIIGDLTIEAEMYDGGDSNNV